MKSTIIVAFVFLFLLGSIACSRADEPKLEGLAPEDTGSSEIADLKILNVFAANDGAARFRAYLVEWKGQEVVVSDPLAKTDYQVGDPITIVATNIPFPKAKEEHRLLGFTVMPRPRKG